MTGWVEADLHSAGWHLGIEGSTWAVPGITVDDLDGDHPFWEATHLRTDRRTVGGRKIAFHGTTWADVWVRADRFICRAHPNYSTIAGMRLLENLTLEIEVRLGVGRSDDETPAAEPLPPGYLNRAARRALCWPANLSDRTVRLSDEAPPT